MKIFSWIQSKLNGKQVMKKTVTANNEAASKEEFNDWPQSILAIGTFGSSIDLRSPTPQQLQAELISFMDTEETHESDDEDQDQQLVLNKDVGRDLQRSISGRKGKDDQKNNIMRRKSLSFLLKRIFTSKNSVRASLPDPTLDKSRMDKILRAILNKKIHPQTSTSKGLPYLTNVSMADQEDNEGSMWVKTDSEYIVLEI